MKIEISSAERSSRLNVPELAYYYGRILVVLTGFISLAWFLIRVIPKPSRAAYPCQRAAAPLASTFVLWLISVAGSTWFWRRSKIFSRRRLFLKASVCLCIALVASIGVMITLPRSGAVANIPSPHNSIGIGKGLHPGRVVWVHAPEAVQWAGQKSTEYWWQSNHTDLAIVEKMMSQAVRNVAGVETDLAAWDAIFKHFNETHNRGSRGYIDGERIAIKINLTTCNARSGWGTVDSTTYEKKTSIMNTIDNSPQMILCLLRQLVYTMGVPQGDISVGDPTGLFPKFMWDMLHPEFPEVKYFDNYGGSGRTRTELSQVNFYWSSPNASTNLVQDYIPKPFADADYIINFAVLKGHSAGITVCFKNLYGALLRCPDGYFRDANGKDRGGKLNYLDMHASIPGFGVQAMGQYRAMVDLLGHPELGGKTVLNLVDGLFGGYYWDSRPFPWKTPPFGNGITGAWPASLFASQDPVAIDSVAHDFLLHEWPAVVNAGGYNFSLNGTAEDYLHEAALADHPASGVHYDPARDGIGLSSLGVHEHWNNATEKLYSRNRGLNDGIELLSLRVNREQPHLTLSRTNSFILLSWPSSHTNYYVQMATNTIYPYQWTPVTINPTVNQAQNIISCLTTNSVSVYRLVR